MKVNAGLYPNANPSLVNSDTKSYALNVLYNEDGETLINENGFEKHHDYSDYGQCIGTIPIPVGVVLFFVNRNGANPSVPDYVLSDIFRETGKRFKGRRAIDKEILMN